MATLEHNRELLQKLRALAAQNRLPHAILLEGEAGSGKKTCAQLIAQMFLCGGEGEPPCGACAHCLKLERGAHPDWRYFAPPPDKKEFTVDMARALRQECYIAPNEGRYKIYVLDKAHEMNAQAQNALLKTLEEPPAHARFILLCENRSRMLDTILSRVMCFSLARPTPEQCAETLARLRPESEPDKRTAAALAAAGNIGRALAVLDDRDGGRLLRDARLLLEALLLQPRYESLRLLAGYEKDRKKLVELLMLSRKLLGDLAVQACTGRETQGPYARTDASRLVEAAKALNTAVRRAQANGSIPLLCACLTEDVKNLYS